MYCKFYPIERKFTEKSNNAFTNERIQHIAKVINFLKNTKNSQNQ